MNGRAPVFKERGLAVEVQSNKASLSPSTSQRGAAGVNDGGGAAVIRFPAWRGVGALSPPPGGWKLLSAVLHCHFSTHASGY